MSWNKRQIVESAFEDLGLGAYEFDLSPDMLQSGLKKLDLLMADWNGHGVRLGYDLTSLEYSSLTQASNVPDWSLRAIITNLAKELAPSFGKVVTRELKVSAKLAFDTVLARTANQEPLEMQFPETLPRGAGARNRVEDDYFPKPIDHIEIGPDGELRI